MWTPSALVPELRRYAGPVRRMVEGQHVISTNRLSSNSDDQALLERLADAAKPSLPDEAMHKHWLLAGPFRYGYGRPSRYRAATERHGIFYAAEDAPTAAAEAAYWRLRAFERVDAPPPETTVQMSLVAVEVVADRALDLPKPPLDAHHEVWTHPSDYLPTQAFAACARGAGASLLRAPSARLPGGVCVPVFDPAALVSEPMLSASFAFTVAGGELLATSPFPERFNARYRLDCLNLLIGA